MKRNLIIFTILSLFVLVGVVQAQGTKDDVHLFQNFFRDAGITKTLYGEAGVMYYDYDAFSSMDIPVRGGYPLNEQVELNASIGYLNWSVDGGDSESGLTDLYVGGRYNIVPDKTKISVGGYATLPIGEEKVGQEKLNFGAFGALRHPLDNGMVITGTAGLDFMETTTYETKIDGWDYEIEEKTEYENAFVLGGGVIYPVNAELNAVGEFVLKTEGDYMALSAGADYKLQSGSRVRGGLLIGLDDGAPDLGIMASFLHFF
ncbi:transporter [candidate division KSB1 bacterium]|nr:transporter [candidate division KSB1 bacterium]